MMVDRERFITQLARGSTAAGDAAPTSSSLVRYFLLSISIIAIPVCFTE